MINILTDNSEESRAAIESVSGKTIRKVEMLDIGDGALVLAFDNATLTIEDDGRSCCENRYMTTDDELADFVGAEFRGVELRDGPELMTKYGEPHEQQFLYVNTSIGTLVVTTHNEHNGYYGGFWIKAFLNREE